MTAVSISAVLLVIAIQGFYAVWRRKIEFPQWQIARPLDTLIDVSQPKAIDVPFVQSCNIAHSELLCLSFTGIDLNTSDIECQLQSLAGSVEIKNAEGDLVQRADFSGRYAYPENEHFVLARLDRFPVGDYNATVSVTEGTSFLNAESARLFARYELCGCEMLMVYLVPPVAVFLTVLSFIVLFAVAPRL